MKEDLKNIETHYLFPSNLIVPINQVIVTTVLGSCIAVCLYNSVKEQGGINHYMLPLWNGKGLASPKFGNIAIELLIEKMLENGSEKKNLIVKLFGGANQTNSTMQIGTRNIKIALDLLKKHKITIVGKSVGGEIGRKIIFDTASREVRMKYIGEAK